MSDRHDELLTEIVNRRVKGFSQGKKTVADATWCNERQRLYST